MMPDPTVWRPEHLVVCDRDATDLVAGLASRAPAFTVLSHGTARGRSDWIELGERAGSAIYVENTSPVVEIGDWWQRRKDVAGEPS